MPHFATSTVPSETLPEGPRSPRQGQGLAANSPVGPGEEQCVCVGEREVVMQKTDVVKDGESPHFHLKIT